MKRLILFRHAKSSWKSPAKSDFDRPLSRRGRRAAARMADWLAANGCRPDLVLCSAAARTRETHALVGGSLGDAETRFERALYLASAARLLQRLRRLPAGIGAAMLIGHNPGLQSLALGLLGRRSAEARARIAAKLPTAAIVRFEADIADWADLGPETARLVDCIYPRDLD